MGRPSAGRPARGLCWLAVAALAASCAAQPSLGAPEGRGAERTLGRCAAGSLALAVDAPISPETGENAQVLALRNRGRGTCVLIGYPRVALMGGGGRILPFRYRHGGRYVTSARPRPVRLRGGGGRVYFIVAKYRCDLGISADARTIRVRPPRIGGALHMALRTGGYPTFGYCRHPGADPRTDPGNTVIVSPLGASIASLAP
jgi:hypothetical protein